ncbi:hypothetical protein BD414DRAFT_467126 [Trametes punicea]|nr:hypothetical protein BD414DRAFT_467126 [Trametes punicea]
MACLPPSADLAFSGLHPTTPALSSRYTNDKRSKPGNTIVKPGLFSYAGESEPPYLPPGWSPHVQPEGQLYFALEDGLRFITDAYMHSRATQERVVRFSNRVRKILDGMHISLPASVEIYLTPYNEDQCGYYLADHASHTIAWLEVVDLDQLGIPDVVSDSHLRYALEDLYWQHIEQFPSHRLQSLSLAVDNLIAVFIHGEADHLTSENSTFPYVAKECKQFIRVLEAAKQKLDQPSSVCIVARLWSVVSRHRQQTHYAQERARLSREQLILDRPEARRGVLFAGASRMLFGVPGSYADSLERLFSDELVYVHPWRDFMRRCQEEWRQYLTWSLGLAVFNVLCLRLPYCGSDHVAQMSLACCAVTLLASLALLLRYNVAHVWTADQAATFLLASREASPGYQRTALAFSAPKAAFIWAACIASLQTVVWLERITNVFALAAFVGLVLLACLPWGRWAGRAYLALPRWRRGSQPEDTCQV